MPRQHWKRAFAATMAGFATVGTLVCPSATAQELGSTISVPSALRGTTATDAGPIQYLRFAHFTIPFDVDQSGRAPSEVHLWVSPDSGQSWLKYGSATPDKRAFEFHAAAEGEYLFAVQTRDSRGDSTLAAARPLRIVIDTSKPQLQLRADVNSSGRLVIDYQIAESFLAEASVRLSYSVDGRGQWEELRVGNLEKSGSGWMGRCEIDMPRAHEIELKLAASDLAQNSAETLSRFSVPRTAAANTGLQLASQRGIDPQDQNLLVVGAPNAAPTSPQSIPNPWISRPAASRAASPTTPANLNSTSSRRAGGSPPVEALAATSGATPWNPSPSSSSLASRPAASPASAPTTSQTRSQGTSQATSQGKSQSAIELGPAASGGWSSAPGKELTSARTVSVLPDASSNVKLGHPGPQIEIENGDALVEPLVSKAVPPSSPPPTAGYEELPVPAEVPEPRSAEPRSAVVHEVAAGATDGAYHSRSRSFSLDYSVDSLRGMALTDIELWGTEDRGITWQKWGSDPDRESPFDVQVANDGSFGFRMVIISSNGLVSNRPQDGDDADMWIHVDTDMPRTKITRALYGEGDEAGMLVIDYNCEDSQLHDRPVTLSYSERPTGPWVTIASGLRNTGTHAWKADAGLPPQVYLRVQAVDCAGNTAEHCLELPVNLRGLTPRGRIQGFRPIDPK